MCAITHMSINVAGTTTNNRYKNTPMNIYCLDTNHAGKILNSIHDLGNFVIILYKL